MGCWVGDGGEGPGAARPPPRHPWTAAAEENNQGCWLDSPLGAHGTDSFTIQPNLCDPGHAGDSGRSRELRQEPSATNPTCASSALPFPGQGAPGQESIALACWLFPAAFWDPPHPPRAPGHPGLSAATGWTVFVNLLETSQYSPELHILHALKLTVQATRMTLTDLAQYHVF